MKILFTLFNLLPLLSLVAGDTESPSQHRRFLGHPAANGRKNKGFTTLELVSIAVATLIFLILISLITIYLYIKKMKQSPRVNTLPSPSPPPSPPRTGARNLVIFKQLNVQLTFKTVVKATGNFASRNCISWSRFGSTYRAEISPGITVAVKRLTGEWCQRVPQFNAEIRSLGRVKHPNLVTLIGYYASSSETLLIYNYLPGGSLEEFLQSKRNRATGVRAVSRIALNIAVALAFLHDECSPRILHRHVKPSNVFLDNELNAYLSDFGLSRLLEWFAPHVICGPLVGCAYEDGVNPLSDKSDVYSYGVILLELISGRRVLDPWFSCEENWHIVQWAGMLQREGRVEEVFAPEMWESGPEMMLRDLLQLGLICTTVASASRPTMRQVVWELKQILYDFDG